MNRFIYFFVAIFCVFLVQDTFVSAQTTTPDTAVSEPAPVTTTPARRPFAAEPTLQKVAQTRLLNLAANMSNRMDGAVARLQNVTDRLNTRLQKLEAEGRNVSLARTELGLAQNKLDEAKRNLANIDTEVNAFIGSATPRENWNNLKNTYINTRTLILAAHEGILATINMARNSTTVEITTGTSTPATNN